MQKEQLNIASKIFDKSDKWKAFLELKALSEGLVNHWYTTLSEEISSLTKPDAWAFQCHSPGNFQWYLTQFGMGSLSIWAEREHFSLKVSDSSMFEIPIIRQNIKSPYYISIYECIQDPTEIFYPNIIERETGKFEFTDIKDYQFNDSDYLAWFAGNKTEDYIKQLKLKLDPFFKSKITELLIELNRLAQR